MRSRGHWAVVCLGIALAGAGCAQILGFGEEPPPISNAGGAGGASSVSSSSSAGSAGMGNMGGSAGGGMGGSGGGACSPICFAGTKPSCVCPELAWGGRFGAANSQYATAIAANTTGTKVAVIGEYAENAFAIGAPNQNMLQVPTPQIAASNEIMAFLLDNHGGASWAGEVVPMNTMPPRAAKGVAINTLESRFFVTGYVTTAASQQNAFVASFVPTGTNAKSGYWEAQFGGMGLDTGIAVEHDGMGGAFVLGKSSAGTVGLPCPSAPVLPTDGMFVAHFNSAGGCDWFRNFPAAEVTPKAIAVDGLSVWVTGHFRGTIHEDANPILDSVGFDDMFLIGLKYFGGGVLVNRSYGTAGAQIQANSIAVSPGISGSPIIRVAGHLRGQTSFAQGNEVTDGQTAAFVVEIDDNGFVVKSLVFPGGMAIGDEAHATSITFDNDRLFVAGTFSGPITVGGSISNLQGNNPFLAEIETNLSATKWFHVLKSATEAFTNHLFFATYRSNALYFAGSWIRPITFPDGAIFENAVPGDQNADVIMGQFIPLP